MAIIQIHSSPLGWDFSLDGVLKPGAGYPTAREATTRAITAARVKGLPIDYALAPADRKVCRDENIRVFANEESAQLALAPKPAKPPTPVPELSDKELDALAAARSKRAIATERTAPEGYRSVEHFLDVCREFVGRTNSTTSLAAYLDTNPRSVRKWLNKERIPLQDTLNGMATWLAGRKR